MTRHEILCKISHYNWMLSTMELGEKHKYWLSKQLIELNASLAQFHPLTHSLNKKVKAI